jgi:hypothetical protein
MQASIKMKVDGSVALDLDIEAARTIFASVIFAARFHERIAPLVEVAKEGLLLGNGKSAWGSQTCQ